MTPTWRAELVRIATVRGLWMGALLSALATPVFSLLVVSTGGLGSGATSVSGAATGTMVGLLGFGAWAAAATAGEYVHGTITVSLTLVPRRRVLYAARVGVPAAVAALAALVAAPLSLLIVRAASPSGSHPLGHPLDLAAMIPAYAVVAAVGAALGILLRGTTSAILVVAGLLLLPRAAGSLLGGLQRWVIGSSPATVVTQFVGNTQLSPDQSFPGGGWPAVAAMVAGAVVVVIGSSVAFVGRDA